MIFSTLRSIKNTARKLQTVQQVVTIKAMSGSQQQLPLPGDPSAGNGSVSSPARSVGGGEARGASNSQRQVAGGSRASNMNGPPSPSSSSSSSSSSDSNPPLRKGISFRCEMNYSWKHETLSSSRMYETLVETNKRRL